MSRMLGAGRTGQVLAALATATCAEFLGAMHLLTTTVPDFLFWAVTLVLVLKLLTQPGPALVGGHRGVRRGGLRGQVEHRLPGRRAGRRVRADPGPAAGDRAGGWSSGAVLAAALAAPDVVWQAAHGWPAFDVFGGLQQSAGHNRAGYWIAAGHLHRPGAGPGLGRAA